MAVNAGQIPPSRRLSAEKFIKLSIMIKLRQRTVPYGGRASHYKGPVVGLATGELPVPAGRRIPSRNMRPPSPLRAHAAAASACRCRVSAPLAAPGCPPADGLAPRWPAAATVTCQAGCGGRVFVTSPQYLPVTVRAVITTVRLRNRLGTGAATRCRQSLGNLSLRSLPFTCGVRT